jgi:UDP-glucose 4-epimerase
VLVRIAARWRKFLEALPVKRVLITGASGFVGANLARRVLQEGHETHLLVRHKYQRWRLEEIISDVRLHEVDLLDSQEVRSLVSAIRPDWVFHLAAYGAYSNQVGIRPMMDTNLLGCISLLDACVGSGVQAFVQTGSSSEYGYKDHPASEDEIAQPNSHYAITKLAATHYCQLIARQYEMSATTVRLYSIYGPYEEPTRLIPTLVVYGLHGDLPPMVSPTTARDFVYVDDAVEAILRIAAVAPPAGVIYNICSGAQSTIASVVETARRLMGITCKPAWFSMAGRSWDTDVWVGSPERMARDLNWRVQVDFESGLSRTIEWLRDNQRWKEFYFTHLGR